MKRFLSMLATLVLVGQSVVTPFVYATDFVNENEDSVSETVVETVVDDPVSDESDDIEVATDVDNPLDDAEDSAELEESADAEESVKVEDSDTLEESKTTEDTETSEVAETEKVEETVTEEPEVKATRVESANVEEESVSYPAVEFYGHDRPIQVNASAEEGVFPQGTTMKVSLITTSEAEDIAKQELGDAVKTAIGVDISFRDVDGNEIEPKNAQDVHISVSLINKPFVEDIKENNLTVVHQDNDGNTQSIQNVEVDKGYAQAKAEFDHNHFSIFVIALVEGDSGTALCTYNFKSGGEILNTQIVKNGEKLVNPGTPDLTSETGSKGVKQFLGWYNGDDKIEFGAVNDCTKTTTIDINAKIVTTYYLTFIAEEEVGKTKVEGVQQFTINEGEPTKVTFDDVTVVAANIEGGANRVSIGWSTTQDGTNPVVDNTVDVSEIDTLYAIIEEGYWIYFNENDGGTGGGASYVGPKYLVNGITEGVDMPQSVRKGYEFKGWYKDAEGTEEFNWGSDSITENTTLYAKWEANKNTTYTVIIWKQNVSGGKDASGNVLYDFGESYTGGAVTDTGVTESLYRLGTQKNYEGFTYSGMKLDEKTVNNDNKVRAKGDTIINLYYDRDTITLNFNIYDYTYTVANGNDGTQYGLIDGEYVELYRYGGKWYSNRSRSGGSYYYTNEYEGTRYTRSNNRSWNLYKSMTGLYGQTLADRNYTWPIQYDWYEGHDSNNNGNINEETYRHLTFLDSFLEDQNLYGKTPKNGSCSINHYKQNVDGSYNSDPTNYTNIACNSNTRTTYYFSNKYDGFTVTEYHVGKNYSNNNWEPINSEGSVIFTNNNLYIHYTRNNYDLTLMDEEKIHETKTGISYEKSLSEYENQISDPDEKEGKEFKGWYEDKNGQKKFDRSSTMPANNKVLYAYYETLKYPVSLNPDGGTLIETQIPKFNVDYGEVVSKDSLMATSKSGFELVGWFDDSTNRLYSFGGVTTGVNLTAKWRKPGEVKVNYDVNGGSLNDSWKDNYGYATNSAVKVTGPATKDGYTFIAWELLDKNGASKGLYYPNGNFTISDELVKYNEGSTTEGTVTLKAKYEKTGEIGISTEKTTITYKANDGTSNEIVVSTGSGGKALRVNESVKALGSGTFTREGYDFIGWSIDPKATEDSDNLIAGGHEYIAADNDGENVLYAIWKVNNYDYTVEYYYNNVKDETKTETGNVEFNSTISTYTDKVEFGYTLSGTEGLPLTITTNPEDNVIKVYYKIDENQTKELSYKVEYYKDDIKADEVTKTGSVQVLQPDTLTFDRSLIDENKYTGYTLSGTKPDSIGDTVNSGDTIKVYYVKRNDLHYTVNYLEKDTNKVLTGAKTVEGQIFGNEITSANEKVEISGYNYDSVDPETLTIAEENNVINVYYTKKNNLSYVVHYYEEGTMNRVAEDKTKTNQTFGDEVKEIAISIDGYNTTGDAEKTIIIAEEENEITFYYKKRTDLSYTVYYKLQGTDKDLTGAKTETNQTFGSKVTENAVTIEGYTVVAPSTAEIEITTGTNEYTFYYKANEDTAYKVEHYLKDLNAETYTLTGTDNLSGVTNEVAKATPNAYEGFTFDENNKNNVLTGVIAADGSLVLKVYYKRDTHIVTFDETGFVCEYGDTLAVPKEIPTKTGDAQYSYTFAGWKRVGGTESGAVLESGTTEVICEDVTYKPTFNSTTNEYLIRFVDEDGTELQSGNVAYGVKPEYNGNTPEKEADTVYTYAFSGWTPEVVEVTGEATYTATYSGTYIDYTVTFDNTGVQCHSGEKVPVPTYIPTKDSDETYTYEFAGWKIVNSEATSQTVTSGDVDCGNIKYESTFKGTYIEYSVKWMDDTELSGAVYHYNDSIVKLANPTKSGFVFSGWNPTVAEKVTGDATYTATWKDDKNNNGKPDEEEYRTIKYTDGVAEETVFADKVFENQLDGFDTPKYTDNLSGVRRDYVFAGWNPAVAETVSGDATYEATWKDDKNNNGIDDETEKVTLTFNAGTHGNIEGNSSKEIPDLLKDFDNYPEAPVVTPAVEYEFDAWTPAYTSGIKIPLNPITSFTATYKCAADYHDQSLETKTLEEGSVQTNSSADAGEASTADLVCVSNTQEGMACVEGNKPANSHFDSKTGTGTWNGTGYDVACPWSCDSGYTKDGESCKRNGGGGGGGGGSSSSSYRCENLPENAVANNTDKPNRNTDYSYSDDTSKVCTFQCKSGYTRDKDNKKCVKSENPGGGDGGEEEIELGGQVSDKCSVEGFKGSEEEKAAYLYACENDITTIRDINEARLKDFLTRAEMAKMVSVFATKELGMKPNTSKDCSNFANSISHYNQEMKDYMVMSCQLELMGIHTVNYEPIPDFMPSKRVSRAEFGTVLSRVLWGNKYEGTNSNYYINHLNALKENNIITNINPNITEYRAWVFLMLYRAVEAIKVLKSTNNVAIDQQVNEELQEEGKAETGLVVEYDSGSVVPDMATLTESGTLATGEVVKVESGNVAESQTGATTLTGEDVSKEVSAETGAVAETGSTSD